MRLWIFFKKEISEIIRTQKIFVIPAVFLFFGLTSPLTARYMQEIIKALGGAEFDVSGVIPKAEYFQAYAQFFKNLNSICIIVLVLIFAGTVVNEKVKGSAVLVLTKGIKRSEFIFAKFLSGAALFTFSYIISAVACIYYTYLLFPKFLHEYLWMGMIIFWVYGIFLISMAVFISTISRSYAVAAVLSIVGYILLSILSLIPIDRVNQFNPGFLAVLPGKVLYETVAQNMIIVPTVVTSLLAVILIAASISIFKKQEI
ncbi:MAG: ABC transporter permease [Clostridia bacterium]|nr:ABC transporter permease [Clostridia bacterium]